MGDVACGLGECGALGGLPESQDVSDSEEGLKSSRSRLNCSSASSMSVFTVCSVNRAPRIPAGRAKSPTPMNATTDATTLPSVVTGTMSLA